MWRGALRLLAFGGAVVALVGATSAMTETTTAPTIVKAKVDTTGKVDQDEIHLSKSGGHQVHWDVEGTKSLSIVPDEPAASWPLKVNCVEGHCEGTQKADAAVGRHPYHTVVGDKAGADPVIIIDG